MAKIRFIERGVRLKGSILFVLLPVVWLCLVVGYEKWVQFEQFHRYYGLSLWEFLEMFRDEPLASIYDEGFVPVSTFVAFLVGAVFGLALAVVQRPSSDSPSQ